MEENFDLACIRIGTSYAFDDAVALASRTLAKARASMDEVSLVFSNDLFIAVAMQVSVDEPSGMFKDMLDFIVDPEWDSALQMVHTFSNNRPIFTGSSAEAWLDCFEKKLNRMDSGRADMLVKQSYVHWRAALDAPAVVTKRKLKPRASVQVFKPESLEDAMFLLNTIKQEKKNGCEFILRAAQINDGYRLIPNAKKGVAKLQEAKGNFENLIEPINRLQTGLVLASCMKPQDFHLAPILLLGEPGIGKTFLATQLAKSLDVPMEKISAGGAQGGFQLTGSHSTWTAARPGALISLLATGKYASPVVVIDEVDKIRDSHYPVLPVLLDLLEPGTGSNFKDEFFEMQFDASKVIFVLTANSLAGVPASLLSRCEVFNVPRPEPKQRLRIIKDVAEKLRMKTGKQIALDKGSSEQLAERVDIDLRRVTFLVEDAFAKAIQSGETVACLWVPKRSNRDSALGHVEVGRILH